MSQTKAQLISDLVQALNFTGTASAPTNGLFLSASNQLKLATASTERLKIDGTEVVVNDTGASVDFRVEGDTNAHLLFVDASTDRVGIGTSSPTNKLTLFGTGAGEATLQIEGEGGADPYINFLANNTQHWSAGIDDSDNDSFKIAKHSALGTNDYFVVTTAGNVGIGLTSSPTLPLAVQGANNTTFDHVGTISLQGTDAYDSGNAGAGINFSGKYNNGGNITTLAQISGIKEDTGDGTYDGALTFGVRNDAEGVNIERMRIDSSGNVGINTTSPDEKLHITNAATFAGLKVSTTNSTTRAMIELNGKDGSGNEVELRLGGFGDTGRGEIFTVTNHAIGFATNNAAAQFKMNTNGNFQIVDGNLTVANGHGVDFSATGGPTNGSGSSELLDDYEEGTFTPAVTGGLSAGQISYNSRSGKYTKIGNLVTFSFHMNISSCSLDSGALKFGGMPFTSVNSANLTGSMVIMVNSGNIAATDTYRHIADTTDVAVVTGAGDARAANTTTIDAGNRVCSYFGYYYVS